MTKLDAVWDLMWEYASTKPRSKTSYKRVIKDMTALDLDDEAKKQLLYRLQYHDHFDKPYDWLQKVLAK